MLAMVFAAALGQAQNNSAEEICPILVGSELPNAEVRTIEGEPIQIQRMIDGIPTVIVVYRGGWCPYCNKQMKGLAKAEEELKELGFQILAISPDDPEHLSETMGKHELPYTLLSDSKLNFIDAIGVGFKVDGRTISRYKKWGIDLVKASGETHERLPVPTVLLLDDNDVVQFTYVNPNYKVRLDEGVLLAAARSIVGKK